MPDKKLTDSEIIKALECCASGDGGCDTCQSLACDGCELYEEAESKDNAQR